MSNPNIGVAGDIVRAATLPIEQRAAAIGQLLPRIRRFAADPTIGVESRINTIVKAARAIDPQLAHHRPEPTPAAALAGLEEALHRAGIRQGPGQPGIGPTTKVTLPETVYAWLDQEAARLGHSGKNARARTIRHLVETAYADATATSPDAP